VSGPATETGPQVLTPVWLAPRVVRAAFTLRNGGVSAAPFDSLNLGAHVGDSPDAVTENRRRVRSGLDLPAEPVWLEQVHGTRVADLDMPSEAGRGSADAIITRQAGKVCVVQVADCMPIFLAARDASAIGVAHAGWRGLAAGVLEATVAKLAVAPGEVIAWLGPAISMRHFEVGDEVREAFLAQDPGASGAFARNERSRWQCDLGALARRRLTRLGVCAVTGGTWCTYADPARFFSFRRDGRCGRMAALIWLE
jgi:YfiH family protein